MAKHKNVPYHNQGYIVTQNLTISILSICPYCSVANNPITKHFGVSKINGNDIVSFIHTCPLCNKSTATIQEISEKKGTIIAEYPLTLEGNFSENIEKVSQGFIKMYNQAFTSEQLNNIELAGMGYRCALEILIKDYALYFNLDTKENIAKLNLNRSIQTFFQTEIESFISADVVRILGNEHAHWDKSEENSNSLEVLKAYLDIFVKQIEVKMLIKHPPVAR